MTFLPYIVAYLFGAISFGVFVLVVLVKLHSRPPGITKHARRDTPIDVQHREFQRKYRDAREPGVAEWNRAETEPGVRYEHLGMTGEEV
jgi:hypothetical protein